MKKATKKAVQEAANLLDLMLDQHTYLERQARILAFMAGAFFLGGLVWNKLLLWFVIICLFLLGKWMTIILRLELDISEQHEHFHELDEAVNKSK